MEEKTTRVDSDMLRASALKQHMTQGELAEKMGINPSALSRKISTGTFTLNEIQMLQKMLKLTRDETAKIFLP